MNVYIVDEMTGRGKSSAAINFINSSDNDKRFLYITPYLDEVDRIKNSCSGKNFESPKVMGTKIEGIRHLLMSKKNIVSTHALFRSFDREILDLAYENDYILIMDEVASVIEPYDITQDDLDNILTNYARVREDGIVEWYAIDYQGEYSKYKKLCEIGCLAIYSGKVVIWLFPIDIFNSFKNIYILTYMFDAQVQRCYYDYYGIEYSYLYVNGDSLDTYCFSEEKADVQYDNYRDLITIVDSPKLNQIGEISGSLSKSWYDRNKSNGILNNLQNNCCNFFKNITRSKSKENLWTTFKDYESYISGKGYAKGFLVLNARATNEYMNRWAAAYVVNVYLNPYIKNFLNQHDINVNEDGYALSEMIQWIWRLRIRKGEKIVLYVPSKRMRNLLQGWINDHSPALEGGE